MRSLIYLIKNNLGFSSCFYDILIILLYAQIKVIYLLRYNVYLFTDFLITRELGTSIRFDGG